MIKIRKGRNVVLGLSAENIKRLNEDKPIRFAGEEVGIPGLTFYIVTGKDEDSIARDLLGEDHPAVRMKHKT